MKVIDLLNKIANGEEVPKKIKCFNYNFIYTEDKRPQRFYKLENQDNYLLKDFVYTLNTRVEIIEEKKIPKKLEDYDFDDDFDSNTKCECLRERMFEIEDKINEIIDYLEENR